MFQYFTEIVITTMAITASKKIFIQKPVVNPSARNNTCKGENIDANKNCPNKIHTIKIIIIASTLASTERIDFKIGITTKNKINMPIITVKTGISNFKIISSPVHK